MKATLGGGQLKQTVELPDGEDENEWIAVNSTRSCSRFPRFALLLAWDVRQFAYFIYCVFLCVTAVHFYNAANMIYGTCAEYCTEDTCKMMSAGAKYEYLWKDGAKYKKPTRVSAPVYIDNLLNWYAILRNSCKCCGDDVL